MRLRDSVIFGTFFVILASKAFASPSQQIYKLALGGHECGSHLRVEQTLEPRNDRSIGITVTRLEEGTDGLGRRVLLSKEILDFMRLGTYETEWHDTITVSILFKTKDKTVIRRRHYIPGRYPGDSSEYQNSLLSVEKSGQLMGVSWRVQDADEPGSEKLLCYYDLPNS